MPFRLPRIPGFEEREDRGYAGDFDDDLADYPEPLTREPEDDRGYEGTFDDIAPLTPRRRVARTFYDPEEDLRAQLRRERTIGPESTPETEEYLQGGETLLGRLRKQRATEGRTSATTGEFLGALGGAAGYALGGAPGLLVEEGLREGLGAVGVDLPSIRQRDDEGRVKPLGAAELLYNVGPDVAVAAAGPVARKVAPHIAEAAQRVAAMGDDIGNPLAAARRALRNGDDVAEATVKGYHATDPASAANIRNKGFNKGSFIATDPEEARLHAIEKRGVANPEVIEMDIPVSKLQQSRANPMVYQTTEKIRIPGGTGRSPSRLESAIARAQAEQLAQSGGITQTLRPGDIAFPRVQIAGGADEPLTDLERQLEASLKAGGKKADEALPTTLSVGEMRATLDAAGISSEGKPGEIIARYRGLVAKSKGGVGTPDVNVQNAARDAYAKALEKTGDPEAARLAARKAAAQEGASNKRASALSNLLDKMNSEKGAINAQNIPEPRRTKAAPTGTPSGTGSRPGGGQPPFQKSLIVARETSGDIPTGTPPNEIVESFKTNLAGKAKEFNHKPGLIRKVASKIGGDLEDPYLAEVVNHEAGLRHALIRDATQSLKQVDVSDLDDDVAAVAIKNLTTKLENIVAYADRDVAHFRDDVLRTRYKNPTDIAAARKVLTENDQALAKPGSAAAKKFDTAQGILKEMVLGADLGVTLQQGLKAARMGTTSALSSAIGHSVAKVGKVLGKDPQALGLYPNSAISPAAQRAADGLLERGAEAVGITRGGDLVGGVRRSPLQAARNKLLPAGENRVASAVKAPIRTVGAGVQKLTDVQYAALNKLRTQIYEGRLYQAKLLGQDISPGSEARRAAAEFANNATSTARTASDAGRALIEKRILLTPQMTRSQFAELAQPFKTFRNPSEALNTANQLLSTAAVFATAYALNEELGVTSGVENFAKNTANPLSKNFGKIVLKARDKDGNHLVWNFMPQFSAGNAILKSVRATQKAAKGATEPAQALEQVAGSLGQFGLGRLNQGFADLTRLGGFGYDSEGQFHWGDMAVSERAKGSVPVPLSAQSTFVRGETDPVSIGANVLGGSVYGETAGGPKDRAAQAQGYEDYASAPPKVKLAIDNDPEVKRAMEANPSDYQQDKARLEAKSEEIQVAKRAEENFATQPPDKPLREIWHDEGIAKKTIALSLTDKFAKQFEGFSKSKYEKAVEDYYAVEKRDPDSGNVDYDATQAARDEFLAKQPADVQSWVNESLEVSREKKTPLHKEYLDYIDAKKAIGYYREDITTKEREELDRAHPDLDVQSWKFGATKDKAGPSLQTSEAVDKALALDLPGRPVKYANVTRPINQDENSIAAWEATKKMLNGYENLKASPSLRNTEAQRLYDQPYDKLTKAQQGTVTGNIGKLARQSVPDLDGVLRWWNGDPPSTVEELANWRKMAAKYGMKPVKDAVQ